MVGTLVTECKRINMEKLGDASGQFWGVVFELNICEVICCFEVLSSSHEGDTTTDKYSLSEEAMKTTQRSVLDKSANNIWDIERAGAFPLGSEFNDKNAFTHIKHKTTESYLIICKNCRWK